jgi:two-component system nitrate/nitrite response regulator NarL
MAPRPISVFACESQPVVVEGLRKALERCADFEFAGAAARPPEALQAVLGRSPDVTLIDHEDGPAEALALVGQMSEASSRTHAVLWVKCAQDIRAGEALHAGARAILVKSRPLETLMECLRVVARGHLWFEDAAPEPVGEPGRERRRPPRLTPRERQVVTALEISPGTVKVHLMHVFEKTGARDRYELAIRSRRLLGPESDGTVATDMEPGANRIAAQ